MVWGPIPQYVIANMVTSGLVGDAMMLQKVKHLEVMGSSPFAPTLDYMVRGKA